MAIDQLQDSIRKLKNPSMIAFYPDKSVIPPEFLQDGLSVPTAFLQYAGNLLEALKDTVPAVRFALGSFSVYGCEGLEVLKALLDLADRLGYYILLDAPESYTPQTAKVLADMLLSDWKFHGLLLSCYMGSDGIKPFTDQLNARDFDLFLAVRTANKSAAEIQDLLTGTRLVYTVSADLAKRLGENKIGRCGYSRVGGVGPATSAECFRNLRSKYPEMFFLIDGYDYSGANAKNCSFAFDRFGHGAVACASESVIAAWKEEGKDAVGAALEAAERMKKNLTRYVAVM